VHPAVPKHLGGAFGIVQVARHDGHAADEDLTVVSEANLDAGKWEPARADPYPRRRARGDRDGL
jgi:hypothetical protein